MQVLMAPLNQKPWQVGNDVNWILMLTVLWYSSRFHQWSYQSHSFGSLSWAFSEAYFNLPVEPEVVQVSKNMLDGKISPVGNMFADFLHKWRVVIVVFY